MLKDGYGPTDPALREGGATRVLALTTGLEAEPSSRYRVYQYLPGLRSLGVTVDVRPLAGQRYLELGYGLRRTPPVVRTAWAALHFAGRLARRARDLASAGRYDVLWVQKETFPLGLERILSSVRVPVVYDFDDAVWLRSRLPDGRGATARRIADRVLRRDRALPALLRRSALVLAGSPVLAEYARRHARRVALFPTVVDTDLHPVRTARRASPVTIGWLGAPPNAVYLAPLVPVFQRLARRFDLQLRLHGPLRFACPGVRVACVGWRHYRTEADAARDLAGIDIGIMPLPDEPFATGKCALKAIQYMASGIPVLASPVGTNADVVGDEIGGLLARTPREWETQLARLLADAELRARLGHAGRARVQERFSLRGSLPRLAQLLDEAAARGPTRGACDRRG